MLKKATIVPVKKELPNLPTAHEEKDKKPHLPHQMCLMIYLHTKRYCVVDFK